MAKDNRVLSREHPGHSKHAFPTPQDMTLHMDITKWLILKSDWLCYLQPKIGSIQSAKTRPGADCGSDHELLLAKIRLKSKKVGETTRPFRHNLNQIPYDYTVEVRNRFKGLDLKDRVPEELWTEVHKTVQEMVTKTSPKKKKCKARCCPRRPYKWPRKEEKQKARERGKDRPK